MKGRGGGFRLKKMMMCIFLWNQVKKDKPFEESDSSLDTHDYPSTRAGESQPITNRSTIQETESSLCQTDFLNNEEARALLGRIEYQKGNIEAAFSVFDGINIDSLIPNIKTALAGPFFPPIHDSESNGVLNMSIHSVGIIFEAIFLKAKSLHYMNRFEEAAESCQVIVDTIESTIPEGLNQRFFTNRELMDTLNRTVEFLPSLWVLAKEPNKAITSYRHALLYDWNLEPGTQSRIGKEFAKFLLYSGNESNPPALGFEVKGAYNPSNNVEEAILLLFTFVRNFLQGKIDWDPSIMDHLSFAISVSEDSDSIVRQLEELPEVLIGKKEKERDWVSFNLLRNLLNERENRNSTRELLLGLKIYAEKDLNCPKEGIYNNDNNDNNNKASCLLGILTSAQSRMASLDPKQVKMKTMALDLLGNDENLPNERDPNVLYQLALENSEKRKLDTALLYTKKLLKIKGGSSTLGWVLFARILSAKKWYIDAEAIVNAALEQTGKWEGRELLRTRAKLEIVEGKTRIAIETYNHLLSAIEVRKKRYGFWKRHLERQDEILEMESWHDLANLYTSLSKWDDAKFCLSKLKALYPHSAFRYHSKGKLYLNSLVSSCLPTVMILNFGRGTEFLNCRRSLCLWSFK